jgi:hypothetical protein
MTERRKALLIGFGPREMCDVMAVHSMLVASSGFDAGSVVVLSEQRPPCHAPSKPPTVRNILAAFRWLATDARAGDVLFVLWIGQRDHAIDALIPQHVDYVHALLGSLPPACKLVLMLESCPYKEWPAIAFVAGMVDGRAMTVRARDSFAPTGATASVLLFTSARESDFAHVDVATSHWHSAFGRAILLGLVGCDPLRASGAEFLAASHKASRLCSPEHALVCCAAHPAHLYDDGLFDFRKRE